MRVVARPTKTYFYRVFEKDMKVSSKYKKGADIACSNMKNLEFFECDEYILIDIRKEVFEENKNICNQENVTCMIKDISSEIDIKEKVGFLVSTHTLSHIKEEKRTNTIQNLVNIISEGGTGIINMPVPSNKEEKRIDDIFDQNFKNVKKIKYGGRFLRKYEKIMSDEGYLVLNDKNKLKKKLLALVSYMMSWAEPSPSSGSKLYYKLTSKQA